MFVWGVTKSTEKTGKNLTPLVFVAEISPTKIITGVVTLNTQHGRKDSAQWVDFFARFSSLIKNCHIIRISGHIDKQEKHTIC